jgi:hypothetical protein
MVHYHTITDNSNITKFNSFGITFNDSDITYLKNNIFKLKSKTKSNEVTKVDSVNPHLYRYNKLPFLSPGITERPLKVNHISSENLKIYIGMTNNRCISKKNIGCLIPIVVLETTDYYVEGIIKISLYNKGNQRVGESNYVNIESNPNTIDIYTSNILKNIDDYIYDNKLTILVTVLSINISKMSSTTESKICQSIKHEINELVETIEYLHQENEEYKEMVEPINIKEKIKNDFQTQINNLDAELYQDIIILINMLLNTQKSDLIAFDLVNRIKLSDNIDFDSFKNANQSDIETFSKNVNKLSKMSEQLKYVVQYQNELQKKEEELKRLKAEAEENTLCKICFENPINTVYIPCGHMICCVECSTTATKQVGCYDSDYDEYEEYDSKQCPNCRTHIKETIITYLS